MNSIQIEKILEGDQYSRKYFKGVFALDEVPLQGKKIKNSIFVINSETKNGPGEHWIAVFFDKNSNCEFFDSLGFDPKFYSLDFLLKKSSNTLTINRFAVQSIFSEFCGLYTICFILIRCRKISFNKFLEYFDVDCIKNDLKINNLIKNFI